MWMKANCNNVILQVVFPKLAKKMHIKWQNHEKCKFSLGLTKCNKLHWKYPKSAKRSVKFWYCRKCDYILLKDSPVSVSYMKRKLESINCARRKLWHFFKLRRKWRESNSSCLVWVLCIRIWIKTTTMMSNLAGFYFNVFMVEFQIDRYQIWLNKVNMGH